MPTYFHKLSKDEVKALAVPGFTYGDLMKNYKQPIWCSYPEALGGAFGCLSLLNSYVWGEGYCLFCECNMRRHIYEQECQYEADHFCHENEAMANIFDEWRIFKLSNDNLRTD